MRKDGLRVTVVWMAIGLSVPGSAAQSARTADDALVAALVWGEYDRLDVRSYVPAVKTELERARERFEMYRSPRRQLVKSSEQKMLYAVMVRYERLLGSFAADGRAQALAVEYVNELRPCYEWEGYHDCPEREASFADRYSAANPDGPFKEYLPLLAAHRWLCAAEGYDYERLPKEAARSRRAFETAIQTAQRSTALIVRVAAETLQARGRCHFPR
jgi:hypothetical protein